MKKKPNAAIDMLKAALNTGITANYVLMDTWFTNEPFITRISELGLDVSGMLIDTKQRYWYNGKLLNLKELAGKVQIGLPTELFGSVVVKTRNNQVPVKLVFVRNRNKRSDYIIILTTDLSLSESEVIRTYGNRWKIEICFKVSKSMLKLGKEFQGRTYDMTVSTTALVLTRYSILEWVRRKEVDPRTLGEIFFYMNDEIKDIELTEALQYIVELFVDSIKDKSIIISDSFRCKLLNWYISLPKFIQLIFPDFQSEVEQLPVGVTTPIPICQ